MSNIFEFEQLNKLVFSKEALPCYSYHNFGQRKIMLDSYVEDDKYKIIPYSDEYKTKASILTEERCSDCGAIKQLRWFYTDYKSCDKRFSWYIPKSYAGRQPPIHKPLDYKETICYKRRLIGFTVDRQGNVKAEIEKKIKRLQKQLELLKEAKL